MNRSEEEVKKRAARLIKNVFNKRKKNPKALTHLSSRSVLLLATLLFLSLFHSILSPQSAVLEDKELSLALASTDVPPYSIHETLRSAILRAQKSIKVAIYALQDKAIISALRSAAEKNNVHVEVVVDPSATENASFLLGKSITVHERPLSGLMHIKLLIIDDSEVWYGTMNFTKSSLSLHGNMACGVKSSLLANLTQAYIQSLIDKKQYQLAAATLQSPEENGPRLFFALHPQHAKESFKGLISRIENAKERVFVAMYTFTHQEIAQSLIRARNRGIDVRVIFDSESSRETSKKIFLLLAKNGVPVGTRKRKGLLHYKCALIDSSLVVGSCNWTKAAFTINAETFSIIDNLPSPLHEFIVRWWNAVEDDSTLSQAKALQRFTT